MEVILPRNFHGKRCLFPFRNRSLVHSKLSCNRDYLGKERGQTLGKWTLGVQAGTAAPENPRNWTDCLPAVPEGEALGAVRTFSQASEETGKPGTQLPKREGTAGRTVSLTLCSPPTQAPRSSSGSMKGQFPPEKLDKKPFREPSGTEPAEMAPAPE
ncbi:hypothetical protein MG293_014612 [Ovis ammon polii]|uniref:Uncharacterized protein n=1 Tax=Ovis ammon polii TaxID=230172 RepID=A0AAD4TXW7_OVIAM|nr:hypothetical protein MG293_014612 [Ovis ammon polii]